MEAAKGRVGQIPKFRNRLIVDGRGVEEFGDVITGVKSAQIPRVRPKTAI